MANLFDQQAFVGLARNDYCAVVAALKQRFTRLQTETGLLEFAAMTVEALGLQDGANVLDELLLRRASSDWSRCRGLASLGRCGLGSGNARRPG